MLSVVVTQRENGFQLQRPDASVFGRSVKDLQRLVSQKFGAKSPESLLLPQMVARKGDKVFRPWYNTGFKRYPQNYVTLMSIQ